MSERARVSVGAGIFPIFREGEGVVEEWGGGEEKGKTLSGTCGQSGRWGC